MSFKSMLKHRCTIKRQGIDLDSPMVAFDYQVVRENVPCLIDLNFIRSGKDPVWTPSAGRPSEKSGVGFFLVSAPIQPGDIVEVTKGPKGVFALQSSVDEAWRPASAHHYEIGLQEIPKQLAPGTKGAPSNSPVQPPLIPPPVGMPIPIPDVTPEDIGDL